MPLECRCRDASFGGAVSLRVGILGATGLVGRTMLALLDERAFPVDEPRPIASDRSAGRTLRFRGRELPVVPVSESAFEGLDLVLGAVRNLLAERWLPVARAAGARVVDNSSAFRYRDEIPLVVPEANGDLLDARPGLVANPNCSTIGMVVALAPLARAARLERVWTATYQSVSGAGAGGLADLEAGVRAGLDGDPPPRAGGLPPLAFNVVPQIDRFEPDGGTREEWKVIWETRKILRLPGLPVACTAVRVPVRVGHGAAVHATFDRPVTPDEARALWAAAPGLEVVDDPARGLYPTPLACAGRDPVLVGRARPDPGEARALQFFVCSDNLRKGAALNAVQIAERLFGVTPGSGGRGA
jgi:aspartate-semialdehyde dehydrogenase